MGERVCLFHTNLGWSSHEKMQQRKLLCLRVRMGQQATGQWRGPAPQLPAGHRSSRGSRVRSLHLGLEPGVYMRTGMSPVCCDKFWQRRAPEMSPLSHRSHSQEAQGCCCAQLTRKRQQKLSFSSCFKVNYLFMHKTQVIVC